MEAETEMDRKYIDRREHAGDNRCSIAVSADSEDELLEAAMQHACAVHGHTGTPEFREQLRQSFKTGTAADGETRKAA